MRTNRQLVPGAGIESEFWSPPFIGRQAELDFLSAQLMACESAGISRTAVCFVGPEGIGKTALAHRVLDWVADLDGQFPLFLDLDDPNSLEPFFKLLGLRNQARDQIPGLNTDGFDILSLVYDQAFRGGSFGRHSKGSNFSAKDLLREGVLDAVKDGGPRLVKLAQDAGIPAAAGVTVGGLLGALQPALIAGAAACTAGALVACMRLVFSVARAKAQRRDIERAHPWIKRFLDSSTFPKGTELLQAMARALGECLKSGADQCRGNVCLTLDPSDSLLSAAGKGPVGKIKTVMDGLAKALGACSLIFTARDASNSTATLMGCHVRSMQMRSLGQLERAEVLSWWENESPGAALPAMLDVDAIHPREFCGWWIEFSSQSERREVPA